jgi:hypothetical protein
MKLTTDYAKLFAPIEAAFDEAVADVVTEAQRRAPRRTGKFADSIRSQRIPTPAGQFAALVGSPLISARVKEKGGYMAAKQHSTLFIPQSDGSVRRPQAVRVGAQPTVKPAGDQYKGFMTARLRQRGVGQ